MIGKIDSARTHQLGERRLGICVRAHHPHIGLGFENRRATRRRCRDLLPHLICFLEFRICKSIDLYGPLHCVLSLSVGHIGHRSHSRRCRILRHHDAIDGLVLTGNTAHISRVAGKQQGFEVS